MERTKENRIVYCTTCALCACFWHILSWVSWTTYIYVNLLCAIDGLKTCMCVRRTLSALFHEMCPPHKQRVEFLTENDLGPPEVVVAPCVEWLIRRGRLVAEFHALRKCRHMFGVCLRWLIKIGSHFHNGASNGRIVRDTFFDAFARKSNFRLETVFGCA